MRGITRVQPHDWRGTARSVDRITRTRAIHRELIDDYSFPELPGMRPEEAPDTLMSVYRSATDAMLALHWAAEREENPERRRALLELHDLEAQVRDLAQLKLQESSVPKNEPSTHLVDLAA